MHTTEYKKVLKKAAVLINSQALSTLLIRGIARLSLGLKTASYYSYGRFSQKNGKSRMCSAAAKGKDNPCFVNQRDDKSSVFR